MASGFPPQPVYPYAIDDDYTLFLVHNTTETVLCADNQAWASEINIRPVKDNQPEIWADNGFATIKGELLYYDRVGKNSAGKVNVLKGCARNLGGETTRFNPNGTWIRSFVIAEHHNQLVDVIVRIEEFVGFDTTDLFTNRDRQQPFLPLTGAPGETAVIQNPGPGVLGPGTPGSGSDGPVPPGSVPGTPIVYPPPPSYIAETIDYKIRHLFYTAPIFDDFSCPDVTFSLISLENDPAKGILVQYEVEIQGSYTSFRLDFGDDTFTTTDVKGLHRYALNAVVDPVITVANSKCQVIQTPIERKNPEEPSPPPTVDVIDVPIPEVIDLPEIIIPTISLPPAEIDQPAIVFPCIDIAPTPGASMSIGPMNIQIPSMISITPLNIPSVISFGPINIPSMIQFPSTIQFPSSIQIQQPSIPPITVGPAPSIGPIQFGPAPSINPIDVSVDINVTVTNGDPGEPGDPTDPSNPGTPPSGGIPSCISMCGPESININWGEIPTLNIAFASSLKQQARKKPIFDKQLAMELGEDYKEFFGDGEETFQVEYTGIGIPSEITIVPPEFPDIKVVHDIPREIGVVVPHIPDINIVVPKNMPSIIEVVNKDVPSYIEVRGIDIPKIINIEHNIPTKITIDIPPIPSSIYLDASGIPETIRVVGFPESITLVGPEEIKLTIDENLSVPLVYNQGPIEMKVTMDLQKLTGGGSEDQNPCVMIVPCNR